MEGDLLTHILICNSSVDPPGFEGVLSETLVRARKGDHVAFTKLFHIYHMQIFTYLVRIVGTKEDGEDLTQETFIKAWKSLASLHDDTRLRPWLYSIATHVALDYHRRSKSAKSHQPPFPENGDAAIEQGDDKASAFEKQIADAEQIQQTLRQMSPHYRISILLYYQVGLKQYEIAKLLNTSSNNVNVYIRRGCEQFRQIYQQFEQGATNSKKRRSTR